MAEGVSVLVEVVLALSALLNAVVVYPVYRKLHHRERTSMASFQLNPQAVFTDFKIVFATIIMFIVATLFVFYGNYVGSLALTDIGNVLSLVSSFMPLVVFVRWWRRFR